MAAVTTTTACAVLHVQLLTVEVSALSVDAAIPAATIRQAEAPLQHVLSLLTTVPDSLHLHALTVHHHVVAAVHSVEAHSEAVPLAAHAQVVPSVVVVRAAPLEVDAQAVQPVVASLVAVISVVDTDKRYEWV